MKAQNTAEKLLRTGNEHWDGYALRFLVKVKEGGLFSSEDQALELYGHVVDLAVDPVSYTHLTLPTSDLV